MEAQNVHRTRLIYTLYIIGALLWPLMLVGVILAYVKRDKLGEPFILSHLNKQIGIFWNHLVCGLVGSVVLGLFWFGSGQGVARGQLGGGPIFVVLLVFLFHIALVVYVIVSSVRGLDRLEGGEAAFKLHKDGAALWS